MTLMRTLLRLSILCLPLLFLGASCFGGDSLTPSVPITLKIWRVNEPESTFAGAEAAYKAIYPYVSFEYTSFTEEEYEDALLSAWAKGEGPDIFSVPNWRLGKYREFISPMPETADFRISHIETTLGKKTRVVELRSVAFPTLDQLKDRFVDVVSEDVVFDRAVYGLPLSIDTLGMYYNRDVMARGQVAVPPTTWEEFKGAVQAISTVDSEKKIVLPAAAIGTANNIPNFFDLVSLIMMQAGVTMMESQRVAFNFGEGQHSLAVDALTFYKAFSDKRLKTYTWNDEQPQALEAFTQGSLGFYFGYYRDLKTIKERASNLNFSYTKVPQIDTGNPVNYANYYVETVHINSKGADQAWDFLNFMSSSSQVGSYLEASGNIPAVRALVGDAQLDTTIGVFAQQALTAESWYHGVRPDTAYSVFKDMTNQVLASTQPLQDIVNIGASQVQLTIQ